MTWGEIQVITLQKMFVNEEPIEVNALNELKNNDDYKVFLNSMPAAANEGIRRLYAYGYPKYNYDEDIGEYTQKQPDIITSLTKNEYRMKLSNECCVLLPLYIASELYKDDDISLSTIYRNEFETGLLELQNNIENPQIDVIFRM